MSSTQRILVVEDEPLVAMDLLMLLSDAGYEVVGPADTVASALEFSEAHELQAALLDLNLGGEMTGPVLETLLEASVPVVLLTGYDAKQMGAPYCDCPVVRKPFEPKELLRVLELVIAHPLSAYTAHAADHGPHRRI